MRRSLNYAIPVPLSRWISASVDPPAGGNLHQTATGTPPAAGFPPWVAGWPVSPLDHGAAARGLGTVTASALPADGDARTAGRADSIKAELETWQDTDKAGQQGGSPEALQGPSVAQGQQVQQEAGNGADGGAATANALALWPWDALGVQLPDPPVMAALAVKGAMKIKEAGAAPPACLFHLGLL